MCGIKTLIPIAYTDEIYLLAFTVLLTLVSVLKFYCLSLYACLVCFHFFNSVVLLCVLLDMLAFNERMVGNFTLIHFKVIEISTCILKAVTAGVSDL